MHFLIVDDSPVARMMVRAIVQFQRPGWVVDEAVDGEQALEKVAVRAYDLITLDLNMPGMDGLTLAPKVMAQCPKAKVALLTSVLQDRVRAKAETQGMSLIPKPITEDKIIEFIKQVGP